MTGTRDKCIKKAGCDICTQNNEAGDTIFSNPFGEEKLEKPKLLLHSCCGPCSTAVIERLIGTYKLTIFFYNPNIDDKAEYERRKETQLELLRQLNENNIYNDRIEFLEGEYDSEIYYEVCKGLENEKEGGLRCTECFRLRLERTAVKAKTHGFDTFATTLTVSPYKNYKLITEIGMEMAFKYGLSYLDMDFKKKDGYRRSVELSKIYGLYRQHFCGCSFSNRQVEKQIKPGGTE